MDSQSIATEITPLYLVTDHVGYGKFHRFYTLMEQIDDKPYCVPDDFLSYASPVPSEYETALLSFLSDLESITDECVPKHGDPCPIRPCDKHLMKRRCKFPKRS